MCAKRRGFTLVELLITIAIIGILVAGVMAVLQAARETAKAAKTKATITKLHWVMMRRYESYRTRRVSLNTQEFIARHDGDGETGNPSQEGNDYYSAQLKTAYDEINLQPAHLRPNLKYRVIRNASRIQAHARLMAIRDTMRMEMPDRVSDIKRVDADENEIPVSIILDTQPAISKRYRRLYDQATKLGEHPSAEFLYMIVMSIPEAAEQFRNVEIADTDGNGLNEFIDGWQHPIRFLRWPAGFLPDNTTTAYNTIEHGAVTDLQDGETPDPFNALNNAGDYAMYPLIYSAGPDGLYDINTGWNYDYSVMNPYIVDVDGYQVGQPLHRADDGVSETPNPSNLHHYDNIHNHMLEVR